MMFSFVFIFLNYVLCVLSLRCGYKSCHPVQNDRINVHLVPHSHDDVGWLKTVNQYYYGTRNRIQHASVHDILDSVINELMKDPDRRFIWVESAFLFKWYEHQSPEQRKNLQTLIDDGRLEIVGGAWSMNDEGSVHYQSVVDQFTFGIKKLAKSFGSCARPHVGWQIDPFGHSREQASIFAQMGFDGQFVARVDWLEKNSRLKNLDAELIWHTSENLDAKSSNLFTGLLYNHYSAPPGFCFDILCSDDPIIDDEDDENNVDYKIDEFIKFIKILSKNYRSRHLLVPMGDDFNYQNAHVNFENMDKLIKYVNQRSNYTNINIFYSTPYCYLKSLHSSLLTWPTKSQDFFPYSTDWHSYWTGYYSSRPTLKRFERDGNHFLQVSKQITAIAKSPELNINKLREAMSVMQHHDAITGTEKQHVANDYNRKLYEAIELVQNETKLNLQRITNLTTAEFESCFNLNISVCSIPSQLSEFTVTLFNPLSYMSTQYVRVPINGPNFVVRNSKGELVPSQVIGVPKPVVSLPFRSNETKYEIVFRARVAKVASFHIIKEKVLIFWKEFLRSQLRKNFLKSANEKYQLLSSFEADSKDKSKNSIISTFEDFEYSHGSRKISHSNEDKQHSSSSVKDNLESDWILDRLQVKTSQESDWSDIVHYKAGETEGPKLYNSHTSQYHNKSKQSQVLPVGRATDSIQKKSYHSKFRNNESDPNVRQKIQDQLDRKKSVSLVQDETLSDHENYRKSKNPKEKIYIYSTTARERESGLSEQRGYKFEEKKLFNINENRDSISNSRHSWQRRTKSYSRRNSLNPETSSNSPFLSKQRRSISNDEEKHVDNSTIFDESVFRNMFEDVVDEMKHENEKEVIVVEIKHIKLEFTNSGRLMSIEMHRIKESVQQEFCYYQSAAGNNHEFKNRSSGAYIFRPGNDGIPICIEKPQNVSFIDGPLVKEVHQVFNDWISQVIRIYEYSGRVEFEWLIGPIPIEDGVGKEIITRFNTTICNGDVFYTDGNGREMMKRIRNQREYFKPNMTEWISGNYYPITTRIAIQQNDVRLAILTDRAQGGSSIYDGSLELMLHRRLLNDDAFGVGEALNETQYGNGLVAHGKYYLLLGSISHKLGIVERLTQLEILLPFWKFFSSLQFGKNENIDIKPNFNYLPSDINVITYESWSDSEILIRFENYLDKSETSQVDFNIRPIFDEIGGVEIIETTLDGSLPLEKMRRMDFNFYENNKQNKPKYQMATHEPLNAKKEDAEDKFDITLTPMQIRTFIVKFETN